jgi:hypothetical protein
MALTFSPVPGGDLLHPATHSKTSAAVIPTGAGRRIFFSFAPANESACEVEESLFDLSRSLARQGFPWPLPDSLAAHYHFSPEFLCFLLPLSPAYRLLPIQYALSVCLFSLLLLLSPCIVSYQRFTHSLRRSFSLLPLFFDHVLFLINTLQSLLCKHEGIWGVLTVSLGSPLKNGPTTSC